jgi:catechol 2,3-dioxygenase-like lactoylglutathione lyase family enzyme
MAQPATRTHIKEVATVTIPVSDQERALDFYCGTLGLDKTADFTYGDRERWVEVIPSGAATRISLVRARPETPAGVETGVTLATADVEADHAELRGAGVDVDELMREGHSVVYWAGAPLAGIPTMFLLRDPDQNSLLIVQAP